MGATYSRSLLAALIVLLVAAPVAGAVAVPTSVPTADSRDAAAAQPRVSQTDNGSLRVSLDRETVGNDSTVALTLNSTGGKQTRNVTPFRTTNTTYVYTVPAGELPNFTLAETAVTVASQDGNTTYVRETLDLRYLALSGSSARFVGRQLELDANPVAGIPDGTTVSLTGEAGERSEPLRATVDDGVVRFERSEAFKQFLTPPAELTIRAAPNGPSLAAAVSVELAATAETSIVQAGSGLAVESPLLVDGRRYDVRLDTTEPSGTYAFTGNASGGTITTDNRYLAGADEIAVTVETADGQPVLNHSAPIGSTYSATVTGEKTVSVADGLPAENVTLALLVTSDDVYVVDNVSVEAANVTLGLPADLERNGSYQLGLAFAGDRSAVVTVGDGELAGLVTRNDATPSPDQQRGNESVVEQVKGVFTGSEGVLKQVAAILFLLTLFGGLPTGFWFLTSSSGSASSVPSSYDVDVDIVNAETGARIDDRVRVVAWRKDERGNPKSEREEQVTGGSATLTVPREADGVTAMYREKQDSANVGPATGSVRLALDPVSTQIQVVDQSGDPVEGATVRASYDGGSDSDRTGPDGTAAFRLPVTATNVEVTASHDRFESDQFSVDDPTSVPDTMRLVGKTGTVELETTIDGRPSDAVDVNLDTDDDWLRERVGDAVDSGTTIEGLPIGEYEFVGRVDHEQFSTARSTVTVREDQKARVSLDVAFTFELSADQRSQLDELRTEASALAPSGRLDAAIHRYYASVADSLADTVESVPSAGERFATSGVDPDLAVEGMLSAGRGALASVDDAMNSKHNVDLFSACADMREASVDWGGSYDLGSFLELAEADRVTQRAELKSTFSETESVLEENRGEVSVVSPGQDVLEELQAYKHETRESNQVRNAAFVFVLSGFADAVQGLFDHPRLVDRLNRTVY